MGDPHRRQHLLSRHIQLRWLEITFLCLGALLVVAVSCTLYDLMVEIPHGTTASLSIWWMMTGLGILLVLGVANLLYFGLILTHRAVGPMQRITRIMEQIEKGSLEERLHLRDKDHWQEMAKAFNTAMDNAQQRREQMEKVLAEVVSAARPTPDAPPLSEDLKRAIEKAAQLVPNSQPASENNDS